MREPIFLYYGPHPVHEKMANEVGAEFVACETGSAIERIQSGASRRFGSRPVIIEGGVPLLEAAAIGLLGESGPIIELAADITHLDILSPEEYRTLQSRMAHRVGEQFVDATIAVSDSIADVARKYRERVEVVHPFILEERRQNLLGMRADLDSTIDVLSVGKKRTKNGQHVLREATNYLDGIDVHFVGPDTEAIAGPSIYSHGFVDEDSFNHLFERAGLMCFPALAGAFPVIVLESMCAGIPVLTSPYVGNAGLVRAHEPNLVVEPEPEKVADAISWYYDTPLSYRRDIGSALQQVGQCFTEERGVEQFSMAYSRLLDSF